MTRYAMSEKSQPEAEGFKPFADDAAVQSFGAFSIENGTSRILLHGSLELTKDRSGLERAERIKVILDEIVAALESAELPEDLAENLKSLTVVKNPFY